MLADDDDFHLSDRLEGIVDALVMRAAVLVAEKLKARLLPTELDTLRQVARVAIRGAAIEGARNSDVTRRALIEQRPALKDPDWVESLSEQIHLKRTVKGSLESL